MSKSSPSPVDSIAESGPAMVLVVDDDAAVSQVLSALLRQAGMRVRTASSGEGALEILDREPIDVVLTDVRMPGLGGLELLKRVRARSSDIPVLLMTAHGTIAMAIEAMKEGAAEFLLKPFDRDEIVFVLKKALGGTRPASARVESTRGVSGLLGDSPAMRDVIELLGRAARSTATVLIRGESGTGKELAARAIHELSDRRAAPFVAIHCAALPDALLESELFGYEKGAFTGASCRKPGRIELAQGGTVFLDEIGDVSPATQVKLLRVLQERVIDRIGGSTSTKIDVRFVAATHRDLEEMVRTRELREDLFYRLNVVPITMPPLRAHPEDVSTIATSLLRSIGEANGRTGLTIDPRAIDRLVRESWPGNVRQLHNFIERLIVLSDGPVLLLSDVERELSRSIAAPSPAAPTASSNASSTSIASTTTTNPLRLDDRRRDAEREAMREALTRSNNNRALAARVLGISRRTLYNKLSELGLH